MKMCVKTNGVMGFSNNYVMKDVLLKIVYFRPGYFKFFDICALKLSVKLFLKFGLGTA